MTSSPPAVVGRRGARSVPFPFARTALFARIARTASAGALLLGVASGAQADTVVDSVGVDPGAVAFSLDADCPLGTVATGGGVDVSNPANMPLTSVGPRVLDQMGMPGRLFGVLVEQTEAVGWRATPRNDGSTGQTAAVAAVCQAATDVVTVVVPGTVNPNALGIRIAFCPEGSVAVGGGVDVFDLGNTTVRSSAPVFSNPSSFSSPRFLRELDDGEQAAPIGWEATVFNDLPGSREFFVAAICRATAAIPETTTMVASGTAAGGGFGSAEALCPDGLVAAGGGVDVNLASFMPVTSSTPLLPGGATGVRPIDVADGTRPDPVGWRGTARNQFSEARDVKVAAICVPEPSGLLLGAGALAILGALARFRRPSRGP